MISVSASAIGIASTNLFVPTNANTTHSAIKHETTTDTISHRASVDSRKSAFICVSNCLVCQFRTGLDPQSTATNISDHRSCGELRTLWLRVFPEAVWKAKNRSHARGLWTILP